MASLGQRIRTMAEVPQDLVEKANSLYWGSDASVNGLAQDLDLSKGALYEILAPYPAGVPCPRGDDEMVYANRTARDRGFVLCPTCGLEEEEGRVREELELGGLVPETESAASAPVQAPRALQKLLVGSAVAGALLGFAVARFLRRR